MSSEVEGSEIIQRFDGYEVGGPALKVKEARPREDRSGNGDRSGANRFGAGNCGDYGRNSATNSAPANSGDSLTQSLRHDSRPEAFSLCRGDAPT
jgi:hypothetical protein